MAEHFSITDNYKNYMKQHYSNCMYLTPVSLQELMQEIHLLSAKKSTGIDNIPSIVVKKSAELIAEPLCYIYNSSFESATVPETLKLAKVIPVFKRENKNLPGNYRPISLLSVFNKILEKLMFKRVYSFLERYKILNEFQFGFRKGHSTIQAVIEIIDNIRLEIDKGNTVIGLYVDLSKAFDTVNHEILLHKLNHYGIRGPILQWFKSYLTNRVQVTCCNSVFSTPQTVNIGVPQGSVLGPLLFLIYVNDINNCLENGKLRLFADDTNVFVSHSNVNYVKRLAEMALVNLHKWFNVNQLSLNLKKTCFSVYSNKNCDNIKELEVENHILKRTKIVKYLGMLVDENLTWANHIDQICKKLTKLAYALRSLSGLIDIDMVKQLYFGYVYPHLIYGVELYGTACKKYINQLQFIQNKILKILMCKNRRYSTCKLHQELDLLLVNEIHQFCINVFVFKQQKGKLPGVFKDYFIQNKKVRGRVTRQDSDLHTNFHRTRQGYLTVKHIGAKYWNSLPNSVTDSSSLKLFKRECKKYYLLMNSDL